MTMVKRFAAIRILMTVDAVGGVWRYAMDVAASLRPLGFEFLFVGLGPQPSDRQQREAGALGQLRWLDAPLDWMAKNEDELSLVGPQIVEAARAEGVDLLHLNLPSQADSDPHGSSARRHVAFLRGHLVCRRPQRSGSRRLAVAPGDQPARAHPRQTSCLRRAAATRACWKMPTARSTTCMWSTTPADRQKRPSPGMHARLCRCPLVGRRQERARPDEAAASTAWPVMMAGSSTGPDGQSLPIHHAEHLGELAHMPM
jgi:hypothetical protein